MLAVISGATKGIGNAVTMAFAELGFDLALGARGMEELETLKGELNKSFPGIKVMVKQTDFSNKVQVLEFTNAVKRKFNNVEVIINNIGMYCEGTVSDEKEGLLEKNIETNLYSAYYLTRPFLEEMKHKKRGHIFNICSVVSKTPRKEAASYSISKFALLGFNKVLSEEMRDYKVKVTAVLPGSVNTASWDGIDAPKELFVQPKDIADAIVCAYRTSKHAFIEELTIKPINRNH